MLMAGDPMKFSIKPPSARTVPVASLFIKVHPLTLML